MKGKTALAYQISQNISLSGRTVIYLSLEMDRASLVARRICGSAGVSLRDIAAKRVGEESLLLVEKQAAEYGHRILDKLLIDDCSARTCDAIYRLVYKHRPDVLVVDHIGLLAKNEYGKKDRGENLNHILGYCSWAIKNIAKEFNLAALTLSQLSRYGERQNQQDGNDREPELIDLRDSGELEQNADNVWFLHYKSHKADEIPPPRIDAAVYVKKFRSGQSNLKCNLVFELAKQWFSEPEPMLSRMDRMMPPEREPIEKDGQTPF